MGPTVSPNLSLGDYYPCLPMPSIMPTNAAKANSQCPGLLLLEGHVVAGISTASSLGSRWRNHCFHMVHHTQWQTSTTAATPSNPTKKSATQRWLVNSERAPPSPVPFPDAQCFHLLNTHRGSGVMPGSTQILREPSEVNKIIIIWCDRCTN